MALTVSTHSIAKKACMPFFLGHQFQEVQIEDEGKATCIYSDSAIYLLRAKYAPLFEARSRWKYGHGGWYCRPKSQKPNACRFNKIDGRPSSNKRREI